MSQEKLLTLIQRPVITEKAAIATETANQYVFRVAGDATKPEIKAAVEAVFPVQVESVRVLNVKGKTKRTRTGMGRRSDWKKAYVQLVSGQQIDYTDTL
ncbi:MAG: 50S ribosomal protein L23 [Porticoccaceae bacterium]|jgi:large subunit ribosomal protein L23|nr:50S ribosomal protein L23 [Porticoccaceae bacterium]